jgi:hypothetical protein
MQTVDKFKLAVGILWSLFTLFGIGMLFPPMGRRLWAWQIKRKGGHAKLVAPSRLQLVAFILLASLATAVVLADAFHRSFYKMTGISPMAVSRLMILLPALYLALGKLEKIRKKGQGPDA